ncbi:MAG: hypothetical protein AAFO69_21415 [Bacteroidota bacterium]
MKLFQLNTIALLLLSVILVTSCGEMKEEIIIEKDGSGFYEMSFDMIPMMRNMMVGVSFMAQEDLSEEDSLALLAKVEEKLWSEFPDEVDSIMDISQGVPPEIKNDAAKMAVVEKTNAFMRGGKKKGYLLSGVNYRFDSAEDLQNFYTIFKEGNKRDPKMSMLMKNSDTETVITSNSFFRSQTMDQSDEQDQNYDKIKQFFEGTSVTTVITTPKKIKKVNVKTYKVVAQTDKSVTVEMDMLDFFTTTEPIEIDVKW